MTAQVDVLVPAFNASKTIRGSLASILDQVEVDFRLIVVDDGSTDDTARIVSELADQDQRVELVAAQRGGIVAALNLGLLHCTAPYVARHDADDIAFESRLVTQLQFLNSHPDYVAVGCRAYIIDGEGRRTGKVTIFRGEAIGNPFWAPAREPYIMHPFLMVRREILVAAGAYRHVLHAEDSDLYWRLQAFGRLYNIEDVLGEYRLHAQGVSSASVENGRAAAIFSQLAAFSARRRIMSQEDILFSYILTQKVAAASSFENMIYQAQEVLRSDQIGELALFSSAKLLELSTFRSFVTTPEDFRTIRDTLWKHRSSVCFSNRRMLAVLYSETIIRHCSQNSFFRRPDLWFHCIFGFGACMLILQKLARSRLGRFVRFKTKALEEVPL